MLQSCSVMVCHDSSSRNSGPSSIKRFLIFWNGMALMGMLLSLVCHLSTGMANLALLCLKRIPLEDSTQKGNPEILLISESSNPSKKHTKQSCLRDIYSTYSGPLGFITVVGSIHNVLFFRAEMIWNDCLVNLFGVQLDQYCSFLFLGGGMLRICSKRLFLLAPFVPGSHANRMPSLIEGWVTTSTNLEAEERKWGDHMKTCTFAPGDGDQIAGNQCGDAHFQHQRLRRCRVGATLPLELHFGCWILRFLYHF